MLCFAALPQIAQFSPQGRNRAGKFYFPFSPTWRIHMAPSKRIKTKYPGVSAGMPEESAAPVMKRSITWFSRKMERVLKKKLAGNTQTTWPLPALLVFVLKESRWNVFQGKTTDQNRYQKTFLFQIEISPRNLPLERLPACQETPQGAQFSSTNPWIRSKSLTLLVTSFKPQALAWPAIIMS